MPFIKLLFKRYRCVEHKNVMGPCGGADRKDTAPSPSQILHRFAQFGHFSISADQLRTNARKPADGDRFIPFRNDTVHLHRLASSLDGGCLHKFAGEIPFHLPAGAAVDQYLSRFCQSAQAGRQVDGVSLNPVGTSIPYPLRRLLPGRC